MQGWGAWAGLGLGGRSTSSCTSPPLMLLACSLPLRILHKQFVPSKGSNQDVLQICSPACNLSSGLRATLPLSGIRRRGVGPKGGLGLAIGLSTGETKAQNARVRFRVRVRVSSTCFGCCDPVVENLPRELSWPPIGSTRILLVPVRFHENLRGNNKQQSLSV